MCSKVVKFNVENYLLTSIQSKSKSNCFVYDALNQMHKQYNIFPMLNDIIQWDDDKSSQMRHIHHFKCFVCDFETDNFNPWKEHIVSIEHISKYLKVNKSYSYACGSCNVLFYGPEDFLRQHRINMHCDKSNLPRISILMAELINHFYINSKHKYFCSHWKKFSETSLRNIAKHNSKNVPYYCKYCHITFLCSNEVLDFHALSVEHVTLKCIYLIKEAIDSNDLKKHTQVHNTESIKNFRLKGIPSKLPLIILNRFKNVSELMPRCKFCNIFIDWNIRKIIEHICVCNNIGYSTSNMQKTSIKIYDCRLCNYITRSFSQYQIHVISPIHLTNVLETDEFYSYFCSICNLYMYSSKSLIKNHWKTYHNKNIIELPLISNVLADNYKYVSNHPECEPIEYCDEQLDECSDSPFFQCYTCKIDFHVPINKYNLHKISSEHIMLEYFTLKCAPQDMNTKSFNFTKQSSGKETENGKKQQKVSVINGIAKKEKSKKKIEAFSKLPVSKKDKLFENSDDNRSHSVIQTTNINCNESANLCNSTHDNDQTEVTSNSISSTEIYNNLKHNVILQDSFLENTDISLINLSNAVVDETSSNDIKHCAQQKSSEADDECYGEYVTQRLRNILDDSIKNEIKREIDLMFSSIMVEHLN